MQLWRDIERYRAALAQFRATFDDWLEHSSDLTAEWNEFIDKGGVTADELKRFLDGEIFRHRRTTRRKHLRLIVNRKHQYRRLSHYGGDDGA